MASSAAGSSKGNVVTLRVQSRDGTKRLQLSLSTPTQVLYEQV